VTIALALVAGVAIGLSLGAVGGGGSILAVPVLLALGQGPAQATTGSLVVVGTTAAVGALAAHRRGAVLPARGLAFGLVATGGAVLGGHASTRVPEPVLMLAFATLMVVVGVLMARRQWRARGERHPGADVVPPEPIITFGPTFACRCPRAAKVLVTATAVGLLTGFLGVGGGFLVVPALVLALTIPVEYAAGTSLVVIAVTSTAALATRLGSGVEPSWSLVAAITATATVGSVLGTRVADHVDTRVLSAAFTVLVLAVAVGTAVVAVPALT
jgi:uncharacterized membrane protein YfcA